MKQIIYITTDEISQNYDLDANAHKLSPCVQVVSINEINKYRKVIRIPRLLNIGDVLVEHPYDSLCYIDVNEMTDKIISQSKFFKISEIVCLLGASSYEIISTEQKTEERKFEINGEIGYKTISAKTFWRNDTKANEVLNFSLKDTYNNRTHQVSDESYCAALEKLSLYHLDMDDAIQSLVQMRNPNLDTVLQTRTFHFDLTHEINKLFDIGFTLNCVPSFKLNMGVKRALELRQKISIDIKFSF
ncbi:MAG: hypothetical protein PUC50_17170 [Bacteroidales bacterium]|nr:hypothetical protein [Bacteroidales bacterium]